MANTINVAAGSASLSSGAFFPQLWTAQMQKRFYPNTVALQLMNRNVEGEIKAKGNTVNISIKPNVSVQDYERDGVVDYQDLDDNTLQLVIDRAKLIAFKLDDISKVQANIPLFAMTTEEAARQMAIAIDTLVLSEIYADATTVMTSTAVTSSTVLAWILQAGRKFDELNIPARPGDRNIILPPWIVEVLKLSDLKDASITGDRVSPLRNGEVGTIDRFTVFMSNNLAVTGGTTTQCLALTRDYASFASQIVMTEKIRLESTIGDAFRSLNVFGFKVFTPDAGISMPATVS
jgi:hypothetical protein